LQMKYFILSFSISHQVCQTYFYGHIQGKQYHIYYFMFSLTKLCVTDKMIHFCFFI
jgi:hypothetical protein